MNLRWIGTLIVITGCGGFGFRMAASHRRQVNDLKELLSILDLMQNELDYRMTTLPELCRLAGESATGAVRHLFLELGYELDKQISPDVQCCLNAAVANADMAPPIKTLFLDLGQTLGRFDLPGQLRGIESVRNSAMHLLDKLTTDQESRLRSYQTLGLCAGAALAILLL